MKSLQEILFVFTKWLHKIMWNHITVCLFLPQNKYNSDKICESKAIWFERIILSNHITLEDSASIANLQEYILKKENFELQFCIDMVIVTPIYLFLSIFYEPNELNLWLIFQLIKTSWADQFKLPSWAEPSFFRFWIWRAEPSWAGQLGSARCELWAEL